MLVSNKIGYFNNYSIIIKERVRWEVVQVCVQPQNGIPSVTPLVDNIENGLGTIAVEPHSCMCSQSVAIKFSLKLFWLNVLQMFPVSTLANVLPIF